MYLTVINPIGFTTSLDLANLSVWRLELRGMAFPQKDDRAHLMLGVAYPFGAITGFAAVCGIDCKVTGGTGGEVEAIAHVGLPASSRSGNKERLREALKVLYNANIPGKDVEEISAASAKLVDAYHDLLNALWGFNPGLGNLGPVAKGELQGWRWALLASKRFSSWIAPGPVEVISQPEPIPVAPAPAPGPAIPPVPSGGKVIVNPAEDEPEELSVNPLGDPPAAGKRTKKPRG